MNRGVLGALDLSEGNLKLRLGGVAGLKSAVFRIVVGHSGT